MSDSKKLLIANWKSNKTLQEVDEWLKVFLSAELASHKEYVICPPAVFLSTMAEKVAKRANISLGIQDMSPFGAGAYTGEISAYNLKNLGVQYAILGHSERRKYFHETCDQVAQKVESALEGKLTPIVCLDRDQIEEQADALGKNKHNVIVAYEPVHAISTFGGHEDPLEVTLKNIQKIRDVFGDSTRVIYGGSVNRDNSLTYLQEESIDGALVGGASLDAAVFASL